MQSRGLSRLAMAAAIACLAVSASAQQPAAPPAVLVQPAESRAIAQQAEFVGRADAREKVEIRARVRGYLGPRLFKDGDPVKQDQVIFTIEKEPFEASVDQRKAQLASAQATFNNADLQLQRGLELGRTGTMPPAQLDQRRADQERAKASVLEAEAALRAAEIELSYTAIKSPIDGRIGRAAVSPGNLIGPDTGVLVNVVQEDPMEVLFSVSQREMLEARRVTEATGTLVARIKLADGSIYPETGHLDFVDVQANPQTDGQIVRAVFPNPKEDLVTGQTVRVIIQQKAGEQTVVIPQTAVAVDQTGPYVFIVGSDNTVEQRHVRLGSARDGMMPVEDGVKAGERVVIQGQQRIRAGIKVTPQLAGAPAG
jgi:membrane fusion protein (multidrug efflux system)